MIRTLLTSTAVAMLMTGGVVAQEAVTTELTPANEMAPGAEAMDAASGDVSTTVTNSESGTPAPASGAELNAVEVDAVEVETVEAEPVNTTATTGMGMAAWEMNQGYTLADSDNMATELMDMPVYSSARDDAEEIGSVTDMVFNEQGRIQAVIIGVGGLLGIGEKSVSVPFDRLQFVIAADNTERWVVETTAEELEQAPDFIARDDYAAGAVGSISGAMDPAADENLLTESETIGANDPNAVVVAPVPATRSTGEVAPADPALVETETMGTTMGLEREGYAAVEVDALTVDNLTGATVVGPTGEDIAEVGDILLSQDGQVEAMLIDFGGFLGIGQKRVAVSMDNLQFAADEGGDLLVYTDFTEEQLEAQPEFDEEAYRLDPSSMLVTDM